MRRRFDAINHTDVSEHTFNTNDAGSDTDAPFGSPVSFRADALRSEPRVSERPSEGPLHR